MSYCPDGSPHHWRLGEPGFGARYVPGSCLNCGAEKQHKVTIDEVETRTPEHGAGITIHRFRRREYVPGDRYQP